MINVDTTSRATVKATVDAEFAPKAGGTGGRARPSGVISEVLRHPKGVGDNRQAGVRAA